MRTPMALIRPSSGPNYSAPETGFAWLRLIGASIVVIEHSFPLVNPDRITALPADWDISLGYFALMGFFAMSGYQISDSWRRDSSWWRYVLKRVLRIWPPLLVVVMCTAFVIGPLVTVLTQYEYWTNLYTWTYVLRNAAMYPLQHILPGVFVTNPYPWSVNGSLWTLPMETSGYILVLFVGIVGSLMGRRILLFPLLAGVLVLDGMFQATIEYQGGAGALWGVPIGSMVAFLVPFVLAMLIYEYREHVPLRPGLALALVVMYIAVNFTPPIEEAARFLLPIAAGYGAITWAHHWPRCLAGYDSWVYGSYGMYIWGMPVQQLYVLAGVSKVYLLIVLALPTAYVCGLVSWRLVELPTQRLRVYLRPGRTRRRMPAPQTVEPVAATLADGTKT